MPTHVQINCVDESYSCTVERTEIEEFAPYLASRIEPAYVRHIHQIFDDITGDWTDCLYTGKQHADGIRWSWQYCCPKRRMVVDPRCLWVVLWRVQLPYERRWDICELILQNQRDSHSCCGVRNGWIFEASGVGSRACARFYSGPGLVLFLRCSLLVWSSLTEYRNMGEKHDCIRSRKTSLDINLGWRLLQSTTNFAYRGILLSSAQPGHDGKMAWSWGIRSKLMKFWCEIAKDRQMYMHTVGDMILTTMILNLSPTYSQPPMLI